MQTNLPVTRTPRVVHFLSLGLLTLLCACSSGGSGGGGGGGGAPVQAEVEPNATPAEALAMTLGRPALGTVATAGDSDLWRLDLAAGEVVEIELFGTRHDQDTWDFSSNVPRLTVFDTDGLSKLLEHDYNGNFSNGWSWGAHDLDIPMFRAPADGSYYVQVTQDNTKDSGGAYTLSASLVDVGTELVEAEPVGVSGANDTFATAEPITPGWIRGFHVDNEADLYTFTITGPTLVEFEIVAYRNGVFGDDGSYYDTELELLAADGTTVLQNVDDAYFYDSALLHAFSTPGTYGVRVMECCGAGDAGYFLRFRAVDLAGASPEVEANDTSGTATPMAYDTFFTGAIDAGQTDFYSFSGTAGDLVHVGLVDRSNGEGYPDDVTLELLDTDGTTPMSVNSGGLFQTTRTILPATGTYFVRITPDGSPIATSYTLCVKRMRDSTFESEPNDDSLSAEAFPASGRASGTIDPALDLDVYSFSATANVRVTFTVHAQSGSQSNGFSQLSGNGSSLDPLVVVRNADGDILAKSGGGPASLSTESITDGIATIALSFVPAASGTYTIEITDSNDSGSPTNTYVLVRN